jgi:hypothetical protein
MELLFENWINFLKKIGLIYSKTDPWMRKVFGFLFRLICIESILILQSMHIKDIKDLADFTRVLSTLSTYVAYYAKTLNIIYNAKALDQLVELIKMELNSYEFNEKFLIRISTARRVLYPLMMSAFLLCFLGGFIPYFTTEMFITMWFPYDLNNPIFYWISVIYQHIAIAGGWMLSWS